MAGAILNLVLNWILIPVIGVTGAALATCISYLSVFIYRVIDTRKYLVIKINKPRYLICVLILIFEGILLFSNLYLVGICFLAIVIINFNFINETFLMGYQMIKNMFQKKRKN
jgi:O-antigen/teichoic acid export membrane protein